MAVDDEPEPFWNGADEDARIAAWKTVVRFDDATEGAISKVGRLNGSSGQWVEAHVLKPLGVDRSGVWITDCLDGYRSSDEQAPRLKDTYKEFAEKGGRLPAHLRRHPSEDEIVSEAVKQHLVRLRGELEVAAPELVVTLGNAALQVLKDLVVVISRAIPGEVVPGPDVYGKPLDVTINGRSAQWLLLCHPAAPVAYQEAHKGWVESRQPQ